MSGQPLWSFLGGPGSPTYRTLDRMRDGLNRRLIGWLSEHAALAERKGNVRILEAGSGTAGGSSLFQRQSQGLVVALDLDFEALHQARLRDPALPVVAGDLNALPFADGSFDLVWNSSTLEHLSDMTPPLREMTRVTAADGYLFVGVPFCRGPLAFQPLVRNSRLGVWLGDVWSETALSNKLADCGLRPIATIYYFFLFFLGLLVRKGPPALSGGETV